MIGIMAQPPGHDGDRGFGGKCFPKDLMALIAKSEEIGVNVDILIAIWNKNLKIRKNKDWLEIEGDESYSFSTTCSYLEGPFG